MLCVGSGVRRAMATQPQARPPQANRHQPPPQRHSSPRLPQPLCRRRRLQRAPTTAIAMQRVRPALPPSESANRAIAKVSTETATAPRATTSQPVASGACRTINARCNTGQMPAPMRNRTLAWLRRLGVTTPSPSKMSLSNPARPAKHRSPRPRRRSPCLSAMTSSSLPGHGSASGLNDRGSANLMTSC